MPKSTSSLGFSPKRSPRPVYPSAASVFQNFLLHTFRPTLISTVLTYVIAPYYFSAVEYLEAAGHSDRAIYTLLTSLVHTVCYISINLFFFEIGCDILGWFDKYKLHRKPYQIPPIKLKLRTLLEAAVGQICTIPLLIYLVAPILTTHLGTPEASAPLPDFMSIWWHYIVAHWFNDVFFYWTHRLFHSSAVYPVFHKKHHTYTGSISIAAEYAHPVESIVSNIFPTFGGMLLFGRHPLIFCIWLTQRLEQTYEAHSGYCFYGSFLHKMGLTHSEGAAWHDYHHSGNQGNFGVLYVDWVFGTMDHYCELGMTEGYIRLCRKNALYEGSKDKNQGKITNA